MSNLSTPALSGGKVLALTLAFYAIFYALPTSSTMDGEMIDFNSAFIILFTTLFSLIPLFFAFYLLPPSVRQVWGNRPISAKHIVLLSAGLFLIVFFLSLFIPTPSALYFRNPFLLPLIIPFVIVVGYSEELFFRALPFYISKKINASAIYPLFQFLFALLHLYQGFVGFLAALLAGSVFAWHYAKHGNLHTVALAHAVFNFTSFFFMIFS